MSNKSSKITSFILCLLFLISILSACTISGSKTNTSGQSTSEVDASKDNESPESGGLPITKEKITLTAFYRTDGTQATLFKDINEHVVLQELEKRTNIHIEFQTAVSGQDIDQLNILIATRQMPDIIMHDLSRLAGGVPKALADGVIIKLNDYIDKYAPNYKKIMEENPDWKKQMVLDDGTLYCFNYLRGAFDLDFGPVIRNDWLKKLGLKIPETIDELYTVLKAFRTQDPNGNGNPDDELPFISGIAYLAPAFGVSGLTGGRTMGFFKEGNTVKFGPLEPEYKEYITTMRKWYAEKLIDPEFPLNNDSKLIDEKVLNDRAGFYFAYANMSINKYNPLKEGTDFDLIGIPWLKDSSGKSVSDFVKYAVEGWGDYITTNNKYPVETVKWCDYKYSPEMITIINWGLEGQAHTIVNGRPEFIDLVMNNSEGLSIGQARTKYTLAGWWAKMGDPRAERPHFTKKGLEAVDVWTTANMDMLMPVVTISESEAQEFASIMNEITTYREEMEVKFITGVEPIENYDTFVQTIKGLGIERALKMQQDALDRYMRR